MRAAGERDSHRPSSGSPGRLSPQARDGEARDHAPLPHLHPDRHPRARRPLLRARRAARGAAMLLHGNCMNFYTGAPRFLPPHLNQLGLAALAFNRRGHDMVATTEQPRGVGRLVSDDERSDRRQSLRGRLAEAARLRGADRHRPFQRRHAGGAACGGSSRDARAGAALGPSRRQDRSCRTPARSACSAATASTRSKRRRAAWSRRAAARS